MKEAGGRKACFPFWKMLAYLHEAKLPSADWRRHLGSDFEHLRHFLMECAGEIADTVPCPRSGQRLMVSRRGQRFDAYPEARHEADSNPLTNLALGDVALWRLNRKAFERDLCRALDLTPMNAQVADQDGVRLIGSMGGGETRKLVFLGYVADELAGMTFCAGVAQKNRQRCCVVLPLFFPQCDDFLRRCEHDMIVLDEAVAFVKGGLVSKRRETLPENENLVSVAVVDDYKALRLRDGTIIDLSRRTKCRAFVRHLHQRRKTTGNRVFLYQEEVDKLNAGQKAILIQSDDFKYGLFRGIHQHFDLLFTTLDKGFGRYRINF